MVRLVINLKQYNRVFSLAVFLSLCAILFLTGCSKTATSEIKDLDFSSGYDITATLDPYNNTLAYTAQVHIRNAGQGSTNELYFHLYGNLYKTENEGIEVISVSDENGNAVTFAMKDDDQLVLLTLGDLLDSGEETIILFTCNVKIPALDSVYGVARDGEIQLPFFYPQLAMHDENGWNTKPLAQHGDGRYLAISDYRLTIQAPSEYEIVCNGIELSKETDTQNGLTTHVFQANQRRELVFITFTEYIHMERTVGNTKILGYFNDRFRSHADMENIMDAAAFAMDYYNRIYMEYPFDTLVITSGAWGRNPISMEYSGIFTVGSEDEYGGTTYHEMAHQWFYFLVGNNEYVEPWLDEAFATFSTQLCLYAAGHVDLYETWWELYEFVSDTMGGALNVSYAEADNYQNLFYFRGAMFLKELMDAIGKDEFLSIVSEYCETYALGFATTEGFLNLLRERTRIDVEDIIDEYIYSQKT